MNMNALHTEINALMRSNGWTYAYACGYAHGRNDRERQRAPEIDRLDLTEFGHGYWRAYASAQRLTLDNPITL